MTRPFGHYPAEETLTLSGLVDEIIRKESRRRHALIEALCQEALVTGQGVLVHDDTNPALWRVELSDEVPPRTIEYRRTDGGPAVLSDDLNGSPS